MFVRSQNRAIKPDPYQTDENGQPVSKILVESCTIAEELYLGAVVDRSSRRIVFMASRGWCRNERWPETPEKILRAHDPTTGAQPY